MITIRIISLEAEVTEKNFFSIVWKRGPQADETSVKEIDSHYKGMIDETFQKKSHLYLDTKTGKYLSKMVK